MNLDITEVKISHMGKRGQISSTTCYLSRSDAIDKDEKTIPCILQFKVSMKPRHWYTRARYANNRVIIPFDFRQAYYFWQYKYVLDQQQNLLTEHKFQFDSLCCFLNLSDSFTSSKLGKKCQNSSKLLILLEAYHTFRNPWRGQRKISWWRAT